MKEIGQRLRNLWLNSSFSLRFVAEELEIKISELNEIEEGIIALPNELNERFSEFYEIDGDYILNGIQFDDGDLPVMSKDFEKLSDYDKRQVVEIIKSKRNVK